LFKIARSPIPAQRPIIDDPSVSGRLAREPSWFRLRLPAICMTFDPSPTRAILVRSIRASPLADRDYSPRMTRPAAGTLSRLARATALFIPIIRLIYPAPPDKPRCSCCLYVSRVTNRFWRNDSLYLARFEFFPAYRTAIPVVILLEYLIPTAKRSLGKEIRIRRRRCI
jgi:hypothetical protein